MSKSGTTVSFSYDADGLRTKKEHNGTVTYYYYIGSQLTDVTQGNTTLHIDYDSIGPASVKYNGTYYWYLRNAQGDITGIVNSSGTRVVTYSYDAWGNILSTGGSMAGTLGALNPLRYRGYVYDSETGLYYLQSRYYDPEICRFINADGYASTGQGLLGGNAFAYCNNNSVRYFDPTGDLLLEAIIVIGGTALIGGIFGGIEAAATGGNFADGFLEGVLIGGAAAACCFFIPTATGVLFAGVFGAAIDSGMQVFTYGRDNDWNYDDFDYDYARAEKAFTTTSLLAMIPPIGAPQFCIADAGATTIIWSLASAGHATMETVLNLLWHSVSSNNNQQNRLSRQGNITKPGCAKGSIISISNQIY